MPTAIQVASLLRRHLYFADEKMLRLNGEAERYLTGDQKFINGAADGVSVSQPKGNPYNHGALY